MLDNSGTKFKVYTFYYKPFQNGKGFKWASKKLRKSISEALKKDLTESTNRKIRHQLIKAKYF